MMRHCFVLISLFIVLATSSCSSLQTTSERAFPALIATDSLSQKFNIQFDFRKHHFSGLLVVRKMPNDEIRIISTSHFGMSLFDVGFKENQFILHSCIEPFKNKHILKLLEKDFRLLFLEGKKLKIHNKNSTFEERTTGCGFGKTRIRLSVFKEEKPEHIEIKHTWLKMSLKLDKL